MKSQRRQIGGRFLARERGAFCGGQARLRRRVGLPANPEPDGATRGTGARLKHIDPRDHPIFRLSVTDRVSSRAA
jgi:hypothetical protein